MNWSQQTWQAAQPVFHQITQHPFVTELMTGTLSEQRFEFYIQQDALYLAEYGRILTSIASKLENPAEAQSFLEFANDTMLVEKALHKTFLKNDQPTTQITASPTCLMYTGYLHTLDNSKPLYELLGGILPCFWIYKKVGDYILQHQSALNNPYQSWIDTYAGEEFTQAVNRAVEICDHTAENTTLAQQEKMTQAYLMASKMEWMFWDSAYRLEPWLIA